MIAQLTVAERQHALTICVATAVWGALTMLIGRDDALGVHGILIFACAILMIFRIGANYFVPEPSEERLSRYYDDPSKAGIVLAMIWVVV
ncbi:MAG: cytochrome-c oxidase, cbb3-type subunit I, partial [Bradyrhizobium sp.]